MERALIIDGPWISKILSGEKTWEMRSRGTTVRERIGLIQKGSGLIVGEVDLVNVLKYLPKVILYNRKDRHGIDYRNNADLLKYNIAWVLENAEKYAEPIPYSHPRGAVIWVKIP